MGVSTETRRVCIDTPEPTSQMEKEGKTGAEGQLCLLCRAYVSNITTSPIAEW